MQAFFPPQGYIGSEHETNYQLGIMVLESNLIMAAILARHVLHDEVVSALDNSIILELQTSQKCY